MPRPRTEPRARSRARARRVAGVSLVLAAVLATGGCAQMNAALGQQWFVVQFSSSTTMATARHVTAACSHLPNVRLEPIQRVSPHADVVESARYDATNATDADLARLQQCLQRFPSVQGFTLTQPGDN